MVASNLKDKSTGVKVTLTPAVTSYKICISVLEDAEADYIENVLLLEGLLSGTYQV